MWALYFISISHSVKAQQLDNIEDQKPFNISGNVGLNLVAYNVSGIEKRMDPFGFVFSANAELSVYGFTMPFSIRYSDKKTDYTQPFNQFGLSPTYKWATAHIGYRNVSFSNFTLAGHNFLGGGLELNPGKFRFGFVYGRFKKSNESYEFAVDTLQSFTRRGYSARIGVGTQRTFVDIVFLKIKDDSTSLSNPKPEQYTPAEENLVGGINSRIGITKNLSFENELAASFYTTDMAAASFELNDSNKLLSSAEAFMNINQSTELLTAIRSSLNYNSTKFSTRLEYRRIDPGYRSMGAYYFNSDIENITIAPAIMLFKNKLSMRGSIGLQRDNLKNTKKATSLRTISSLSASFNPSQVFGIDVNYSNYSNNQRAGRLPLIDSLKVFQTTQNLSISPRLVFVSPKYMHLIFLVYSNMNLEDKNAYTAQMANNKAHVANLNYSLNLIESQWSFIVGVNYNKLVNATMDYSASGGSAGATKMLLGGKLSIGIINSLVRTGTVDDKAWVFNSNLNGNLQIGRGHSFRLGVFFINNRYPVTSINPSFHEIKGDLSYVFSF